MRRSQTAAQLDLIELAKAPVDEGDPFGSVLPEGYVPLCREPSNLIGDVAELEKWASAEPKKAPPFDARKHYPRAMKALNAMHPGKYWAVDYKEYIPTRYTPRGPDPHSMVMIAKDMLGFADVGGIERPSGRMVCANVTTAGQIAPHLRKYTDPKETHGQAKIPIEIHLREYLDCGGLFYVLGFFQEGRFWRAKVVAVTPALLDEYAARKRRKA